MVKTLESVLILHTVVGLIAGIILGASLTPMCYCIDCQDSQADLSTPGQYIPSNHTYISPQGHKQSMAIENVPENTIIVGKRFIYDN